MDKVKDSVKSADEKLGNAIDCEKLDSKIRDEERKIENYTKDLGAKTLEALRKGEDIAKDALDEIYSKIKECEEQIEKMKAEKETIKAKKE